MSPRGVLSGLLSGPKHNENYYKTKYWHHNWYATWRVVRDPYIFDLSKLFKYCGQIILLNCLFNITNKQPWPLLPVFLVSTSTPATSTSPATTTASPATSAPTTPSSTPSTTSTTTTPTSSTCQLNSEMKNIRKDTPCSSFEKLFDDDFICLHPALTQLLTYFEFILKRK